MKFLDAMISRFDALTLRSSTKEDLSEREKEFREEATLHGNAVNMTINEAYDSIDAKATAILQHVSIMIAVSGILYSSIGLAFIINGAASPRATKKSTIIRPAKLSGLFLIL